MNRIVAHPKQNYAGIQGYIHKVIFAIDFVWWIRINLGTRRGLMKI